MDFRGVDLHGEDLSDLPLARLLAGDLMEFGPKTDAQSEAETIHLEGANLFTAHLEGANLYEVHLEGGDLTLAHLAGAHLAEGFFDRKTKLAGAILGNKTYGFISVVDISWGGVNLAILDWNSVSKLGDERKARQSKQLDDYQKAVRANRQLAVALRNQGLSEEADHFAYRAQLLQRTVWRMQSRLLKFLFSWFLYLLAGYGYRPLRSILMYLLVIAAFAIGYYEVTHLLHAQPYPLAWYEALILSVSSFHGRGFFQPVQSLGDPVAILASIEAVFGLLIEISFIATFTQRFFGK
ncbi:MAG TPA: pentapeptide repeat-containing protein [Ktedonobacteraceae bacterium]